eukprot:3543755-Pyramimonas_sp.AAC.1
MKTETANVGPRDPGQRADRCRLRGPAQRRALLSSTRLPAVTWLTVHRRLPVGFSKVVRYDS